ncbi:unnamed protein product [Rhizoctonia solani]|uniref:non-chaperonin molecular chaperone ATPase n=1 Tax=Rhizoctonia solani TaxID=456999 RepID=A0A8H3B7L5_9AGAM|nr:unnamed protein product [Rhizoctonia solani]CAE6455812.1 unnamed protein product [Rhizoctonia solani]
MPTQAKKRPHDSSSSESASEGRKRRKKKSKKKKKPSKPVDESSDSKSTTKTKAKTNPTRNSDDPDSSDGGGNLNKVRRTAVAMEKRLQNEPEAELAACIQRIKTSKSDAYHTFEKPRLMAPVPGLGYSHYTFKCKRCGELVKRKIGSMETSALLGHTTRCDLKCKQQMLADYGIAAESSPPTAYQTREYCALIVCEHARPQLMFKDRYLRKLISRETVKLLPHQTTITEDIVTMYRMTQKHIASVLADIPGVFHLTLDMYQSPNGFDYLGIVLFHQQVSERLIGVKRFVLECLNFDGSHTGHALANKVHKILSKFDIQDRVWGLVCDNAASNAAMMERFEKLGMARLEGPECRVHCMAHILNLAAQAILSKFTARRIENGEQDDMDGGDEDGDSDEDCVEGNLMGASLFADEDFDHNDDRTAPSHALDPDEEEVDEEEVNQQEAQQEDEDDFNSLLPDIIVGSEEDKDFRKVRDALRKAAWFANKLRKSTRTKAGFKKVCVEKELPSPRNLRRDVKTQWNGTAQLLEDTERLFPAIISYQTAQNYLRNRKLTRDEMRGIRVLLQLLKKSDESGLYRGALLTHPSFRLHYLTDAEWPGDWAEEAVNILRDGWERHYKPATVPTNNTDTRSDVSHSSYLDQVCARLDGMSGVKETNPVTRFVNAMPVFDRTESGRSIPVDPLAWWYSQRLAGEEHDGLTQMAIDIHTTPATSIDVERAFSFVSAMVSKCRHKLGALTIQASASLGAYSRADLIKPGCLKKVLKLKAKKKAEEAKRLAAAEAEAIVIDDGRDDDDEGEEEAEQEDLRVRKQLPNKVASSLCKPSMSSQQALSCERAPDNNDLYYYHTHPRPPPPPSKAQTLSLQTQLPPAMAARPSRSYTASVAFILFAVIAAICLIPVARAGNDKNYGTVIGIDLGTTYSCVGVHCGGCVEIIANNQGNRITPSWVQFSDDERLIRDAAKAAFHTSPAQTVFDAKRLIGRKYDDPEVKRDMKHWPFKIVNKGGKPMIQVKNKSELKDFTPEEISAMVLTKMKETAEAYLGNKVTHAVVTVPAYFNNAQRQATKDAGTIAGLIVLRIVNEPTTAIAHGLNKKGGETQIIVYDLGGGTFGVLLLSINNGVFEVLATTSDTHLGGEDFDNCVIDHFVREYKKKTGTNASKNQRALSKLKEVEKAKRTLSSQMSTKLKIESFENGNNFSETLTRSKFEELNIDLFRKTMKPVEQVLKDANIKKEDISDIVLVSGSTRIPKVQQLIKEYFGKEPSKGRNCLLTLSIETTGGVFTKLIPHNTIIPTKKSQIFLTAANNQPTALIQASEGEHPLTKDNNLLGKFELSGIPLAQRGVPQIEVTFEIDANGILKVAAADKGIGKSESITVTNEKGRLSPEEIERMVREAEEFASEDEAQRKRIKALNGTGSKISDEHKKTILATGKETNDRLEENGQTATSEDLEEKLQQAQAVVNPNTGKLYGSGSGSASEGSSSHDEL